MTMPLASREYTESYPMDETLRVRKEYTDDREVVALDFTLPEGKQKTTKFHQGFNVLSPTVSPGKTGSAGTDLSASPYNHLHH